MIFPRSSTFKRSYLVNMVRSCGTPGSDLLELGQCFREQLLSDHSASRVCRYVVMAVPTAMSTDVPADSWGSVGPMSACCFS